MNVCKRMCPTCIYRPDTPLEEARRRMETEAIATDTWITCHSTLDEQIMVEVPYDDEDGDTYWEPEEEWVVDIGGNQAVCRGYFDRHGGGNLGRIAERLGFLNLDFEPPDSVTS